MKCTTCRAEIDPTNSFCECGAPIPGPIFSPAAASRPTGTPLPEQKKRCPFCSEEILATATKCKHCGSMITPVNEPQADEVSLKPLWNALKIILAIIVAIIAGVLWYTKIQGRTNCEDKFAECKASIKGGQNFFTDIDRAQCRTNYGICKESEKRR